MRVGSRPPNTGRISEFLSPFVKCRLTPFSQKKDVPSTRKDYQAQFYTDYRKVAEEYDKEFLKKHDEDLNSTLIFVSFLTEFCGPTLI